MTKSAEERRAENDKRVAADVATYGCHVISVFDSDGAAPTFSYSVGIQASTGAPEAIVIGLRHALGHAMINAYNRRVRAGDRFISGEPYAGFLEGFAIYVEPAESTQLSDYTLGCERFYKGAAFAVVQLIYPTTSGVWPWEEAAPASFKAHQPLLGRVPTQPAS